MEKAANKQTDRVPQRPLDVRYLGRMGYSQATLLQAELVHQRRQDLIPDLLLLLQHPSVITLGSSAREEHLLEDREALQARGVEVSATGRGGDITYHGPGQIVGYPILQLPPARRDLHRYLRDLEELLLQVLADFGLSATRRDGLTGVWIGDRKLGAIGVRVSSGWITSHGFSLNVNPDLSFFDTIIPCGIRDLGVGSMSSELGRPIETGPVEARIAARFRELFG